MLSLINLLTVAFATSSTLVLARPLSDVYATFYSDEGQIAPNFDISNSGCFAVDSAVMVSFSQDANGPYCLSAWADGACPGDATAKQTFESLSGGTHYSMNQDMQIQGSYRWSAAGAC